MTVPQHTTRPRFVDPAELICPGCGYMACPQPPVSVDGAGVVGELFAALAGVG